MTTENTQYQHNLLAYIFNAHPSELKHEQQEHPAVSIYHNNYLENGIRALSISFPTVLGIMDEQDFRKLCCLYLQQHPKTQFDWADYGESFAAFMFDVDALSDMPFLPELAQLDWCLIHIERAENKEFDAESFNLLQLHSAESLRFEAAPGLQTMSVFFPVCELYALVHDEHLQTNAQAKAQQLKTVNKLIEAAIKSPQARSIVLWREHYKALFEYCDTVSTQAFAALVRARSIAQVLASFGEDQTSMSQWLQTHIASRKIYAVRAN